MTDYSRHTLRLNRQYDGRTRRAMDRFKDALGDVESGASGGGITVYEYDVTASATATLAAPTTLGQQAMILIDTNPGLDTLTINFSPDMLWDVSGGSPVNYSSLQANAVGEHMLLVGGTQGGTKRWVLNFATLGWQPPP